MPRIAAIIQARTGSTRLPGKVMREIGGKTVLAHLIGRLKKVPLINEVVVATTTEARDTPIFDLCRQLGIGVYRGSEQDVLRRYLESARVFKADVIFRATSDEPYKDPDVIRQVLETHLKNKMDYTCNNLIDTFPDGSTVEIIDFPILEKMEQLGRHSADREHVTFYVRNRPNEFRICNVEAQGKLRRPDLRYCLDTEEDFKVVKAIFDSLGQNNPYFTIQEIIDFLDENESVKRINKDVRFKKITY